MFTQDESYIKWKLFLEGDDQAYSWIYTHYIQVLYNYGLQITPDSEIVKDCIQDVFVKIYKAKKKLTVPQNPKVNAARKSKVDDNTARMQSIKQLGV